MTNREIDILIEKHLFGMDVVEFDGKQFIKKVDVFNEDFLDMIFRPFSSDISYAWQVVEKMLKDGWKFAIESHGFVGIMRGIEHAVSFEKFLTNHGTMRTRIEESTAPMAICIAALNVKGVDVA